MTTGFGAIIAEAGGTGTTTARKGTPDYTGATAAPKSSMIPYGYKSDPNRMATTI
jgi:hypothetical protein